MKGLRGFIIQSLLIGIFWGITSNFSVVKAEFLTYSGEVVLKVDQDFNVKAEISLDVRNTADFAINADWLSIKLLDKHIKNANVVVTQRTPVGFYVLNDQEGAWLKVQERAEKPFVLNPGERLKIFAVGDVDRPFAFAKGGMYILSYPSEQPNTKLKIMVHKDISLGSAYKFTTYKQIWRIFDFSELPSGQLILFGDPRETVGFIYELVSKYSYVAPPVFSPCIKVHLISPKVSYLYLDNSGFSLPHVAERMAYLSYMLKFVDLRCIEKMDESDFYVGFRWNAVDNVGTSVIFKWNSGQVYHLVNGQFVLDRQDKYGILYFPVRQCDSLDKCLEIQRLGIGNIRLIDNFLKDDIQSMELGCDMLHVGELDLRELEYHSGILFNKSTRCGRVSRLLCGSINILEGKQLILMPQGSYRIQCLKPTIGTLHGVIKEKSVFKSFAGVVKLLWLWSSFYLVLSLGTTLACAIIKNHEKA